MKSEIKPKLTGDALMIAVINKIIAEPETWDQTSWHCGTQHCFFGHCQVQAGLPETADNIVLEVRNLLGISQADADWLSSGSRSLVQLYDYVKTVTGERDAGGFDRSGFDRDGSDRDGFDRDGFDCDGFNCDGKELQLIPLPMPE